MKYYLPDAECLSISCVFDRSGSDQKTAVTRRILELRIAKIFVVRIRFVCVF